LPFLPTALDFLLLGVSVNSGQIFILLLNLRKKSINCKVAHALDFEPHRHKADYKRLTNPKMELEES